MTQTITDQFYDEGVFSVIEVTQVEFDTKKEMGTGTVAFVLVNPSNAFSSDNEKLEHAYRWIQNPTATVFPEQINGNEYIIRAPSLQEDSLFEELARKNNSLDMHDSLWVVEFHKKTPNKPDPIPLGTLNFEWEDRTHEKNEKVFGLRSTSIGDFMTLDNVKYEVSEVELKEVK
jgi:hypothetical protein